MTTDRGMFDAGLTVFQVAAGDTIAATATAHVVSILDTIEVPIVLIGSDSQIAHFNKAAADVLGLSPSDIGRPAPDVSVLAGLPRLEERCRQIFANGMDFRADFRSGDKWFVVRMSPCTGAIARSPALC